MGPSIKHVLGVLEWSYVVPLFKKIESPPPRLAKGQTFPNYQRKVKPNVFVTSVSEAYMFSQH